MTDSAKEGEPTSGKAAGIDPVFLQTRDRKLEHIKVVLNEKVESNIGSGFEEFTLVHQAAPEVNYDEIDTSLTLFGKLVSAPLLIAGMTGGHEMTKEINRKLAEVAEKYQIPIGIGSQRAAIEDPSLVDTFAIVRETAPTAVIIANLGAPQLVEGYGLEQAKAAVEMVEADALAIHFNPTQEIVQPEGDTRFKGAVSLTGDLAKELCVPVVAKEVGAGITRESAHR